MDIIKSECGGGATFCMPIQILATRRCPNGVYIEMDMLDEYGATVAMPPTSRRDY